MADLQTDVAPYAWAESGRIVAMCVCAMSGVSEDDALKVLAPSDTAAAKLTFAEAEGTWAADATPVQTDQLNGRLICIEPNGSRCSETDVAGRLSAAGQLVSVYWNVNALITFVFASHGTIVRTFDPLLYDAEGAVPEELGLPFGHPGHPRAASLLLLERLMDVRVGVEWLTGKRRRTYWLGPSASA